MKRLLLVLVTLLFGANPAHAAGMDLTAKACPGSAGVSNSAGTIDCAGGAGVIVLVTFQPAEPIADLVSVNCWFDLMVGGGIASNGFWDFQTENAAALSVSATRPNFVCGEYENTFAASEHGGAVVARVVTANREQIVALAYCVTPIATAAEAKLFGMQLVVDGSTAAEAGGPSNGCAQPTAIVLNQVTPGTASNTLVAPLTTFARIGTQVNINMDPPPGWLRGSGVVPASLGRLRSLYR